jgi:signal transduction histidine kinase
MEDISLHIMDIVENSITSGSSLVEIRTVEGDDTLTISIIDDGIGMSGEQIRRAADPFYTTKAGKKLGLGLSLFRQAAEATGGALTIASDAKNGTTVEAKFHPKHPDMKPIGDLEETVSLLRVYHPEITFTLTKNQTTKNQQSHEEERNEAQT